MNLLFAFMKEVERERLLKQQEYTKRLSLTPAAWSLETPTHSIKTGVFKVGILNPTVHNMDL